MDEYTHNQIKKMEQEATKRAREASMRAKPMQQGNSVKVPQKDAKEPMLDRNSKPDSLQSQKRGSLGFLNALDLKKLIGENSEQAMLLLLILILSNDNTCDEYLLYALIYIML